VETSITTLFSFSFPSSGEASPVVFSFSPSAWTTGTPKAEKNTEHTSIMIQMNERIFLLRIFFTSRQ
jgi:hypothetical protein